MAAWSNLSDSRSPRSAHRAVQYTRRERGDADNCPQHDPHWLDDYSWIRRGVKSPTGAMLRVKRSRKVASSESNAHRPAHDHAERFCTRSWRTRIQGTPLPVATRCPPARLRGMMAAGGQRRRNCRACSTVAKRPRWRTGTVGMSFDAAYASRSPKDANVPRSSRSAKA